MRGSDTKHRIIEEARNLFASRGFAGATTAEIARQVGISEAAIYKHFANKKELFIACVLPVIEKGLESGAEEVLHAEDTYSLVRAMVTNRIRLIRENLDSFNILYSESMHHPELAALFLQRFFNNRPENVRCKIEEMIAAGESKNRPSFLLLGIGITTMIWGLVNAHVFHLQQNTPYAASGEMSEEQLLEEITQFVMYGILGAGAKNANVV